MSLSNYFNLQKAVLFGTAFFVYTDSDYNDYVISRYSSSSIEKVLFASP